MLFVHNKNKKCQNAIQFEIKRNKAKSQGLVLVVVEVTVIVVQV